MQSAQSIDVVVAAAFAAVLYLALLWLLLLDEMEEVPLVGR